jgi:hypothetical protein
LYAAITVGSAGSFLRLKILDNLKQMSLIVVYTEVDGDFVNLPAKIVSRDGPQFTIRYLTANKRNSSGRRVYSYEPETYVITDDSIVEYTETDSELYFGLREVSPGEFIKYDPHSDDEDDDEEYEPSEDDEDDDEDEEDDDDEEYDEDDDIE